MSTDDTWGAVTTKAEFVELVRSLRADLVQNPEQWENVTLESFLEAMAAWVEDMEGYYRNNGLPHPENVPWRVFADVLLASRMYE